MTDDTENVDEPERMFPGGWDIDRKPTIEMKIKAMFKKMIGRG